MGNANPATEGASVNLDKRPDDMVRITTPEKARAIGSDYIVVGRPITQAADPVAAYQRCLQEFVG